MEIFILGYYLESSITISSQTRYLSPESNGLDEQSSTSCKCKRSFILHIVPTDPKTRPAYQISAGCLYEIVKVP
jgi:hypothetical protein